MCICTHERTCSDIWKHAIPAEWQSVKIGLVWIQLVWSTDREAEARKTFSHASGLHHRSLPSQMCKFRM